MTGAPKLKKENEFSVILYDGNGLYETSTPNMEYGIVNDKFYYEINDKRIQVPEECIFQRSSTVTWVANDRKEHQTREHTVTNHCSKDFP
ncbi:DUF6843 domain-containing protein [Metabacillus fastidiosus]|uniref:DUF6843 domain-containing protein n=1 Tax=Metabacillus fastidiosus TaxID=1458 RepID=A0ABU6P0Q9_9BACI|nr:hypothetical protein [Metabacillus fastidiosus]MED4402528.1 hypothetical protein [Metabacillus fastidiosus]